MKEITAIFMGLMLLASCASTGGGQGEGTLQAKPGFLGEYAANLEPGPEDGAKMRWLKPDVDWARYNYIMLDSVVFFLAEDTEYKGIDPHELKELADGFNRQFVETLKDSYPIVTEPGLDVLRIRFAITDLKQSSPVMSGITTIVPVGLVVSAVKKGASDSWVGSGATSAEMMALDSLTNEVIAVAQDDETAGFTERFSEWGSAEEAFKYWAERAKLYLDQVHGVKN